MLLNWLKKDIAKDLALVKGIGAGLTRVKGSQSSYVLPIAAVGTALVLLDAALSAMGSPVPDQEEDVPFYDQGGLNHWDVRQWD